MTANLSLTSGVFSLLVCLAYCASGEQSASALSPDWKYQRTITLDPATSRPGSVLLVLVTTDTMGNPYRYVKEDGSDLRFTGPDGKTPLSYWIESWNNTGKSKIWVKLPKPGTGKFHVDYGNPKAVSLSDGASVFDFFDDFNDGIWTKYPGNPVIASTEPWEARAICEPSILHEDGRFKMWYMGCATSVGRNAALGYATSPDGLAWTKHRANPLLRDPKEAVIRTTVLKHQGPYYLFASNHQWTPETGVINRWTSTDGLHWTDKTAVLRPTEPWEGHYHNVGVVIDEDGTWQMLYTTDGPFGYAYSRDGLHWTKYEGNPVIQGFYGGDPGLVKIEGRYYAWHSRAEKGHLRIYCSWSPDMIHWNGIYNDPQIGYTQPWERGIGRPEVHWDRHLTDAELVEHDGKARMYYQGAQTPIGVAEFDGTFAELAACLERPPLEKWAESHSGCVENDELKISDNQTDSDPICERTALFNDQRKYVFQYRAQCYTGYRQEAAHVEKEGWATETKCYPASVYRAQPVMRYVDSRSFARFRMKDNDTTYYEEYHNGVWTEPAGVGPNHACDADWHQWKIVVDGEDNHLYIDGRYVGAHKSSPAFVDQNNLRIGFSVYGTFAAFDDVRVTRHGFYEAKMQIGPQETTSK